MQKAKGSDFCHMLDVQEITWFLKETALSIVPKLLENAAPFLDCWNILNMLHGEFQPRFFLNLIKLLNFELSSYFDFEGNDL